MSNNTEKPIAERLPNVLKAIDKLIKWEIYEIDISSHPDQDKRMVKSLNSQTNIGQYSSKISSNINFIKQFLLELLEVRNPHKKFEILKKVEKRIANLEPVDKQNIIDKANDLMMQKVEAGDFKEGWEASEYRLANWDQFLGSAAKEYSTIKGRLQQVLQDIYDKGGFIIDEKKGLVGPLNPEQFIRRRFRSKISVKALSAFLGLCLEAGIFKDTGKKPNTKTDLARMFTENFVKDNGKPMEIGGLKKYISKPESATKTTLTELVPILTDIQHRFNKYYKKK